MDSLPLFDLEAPSKRIYGRFVPPAKKVRHGAYGTRLHRVWLQMKQRCYNPTHICWKNYGGKGIIVCSEWHDFVPFRDWALANGFQEHLTIDRKDNDGSYSPENCRWSTYREQANNKGNNHKIIIFGETKTICEWSRDSRCAIPRRLFNGRILRGWKPELALTTPSMYGQRRPG